MASPRASSPSAKASEASPNAATTNSVSAPTSSTIGGAHVAPQRLLLFANVRNLILVTGTMVFVCVLGAVAEGSESPDAAMAPVPTTMPDDLDSGTDRLVLRSAPMHCPCGTWRRVGSSSRLRASASTAGQTGLGVQFLDNRFGPNASRVVRNPNDARAYILGTALQQRLRQQKVVPANPAP